MKVPVLGSWGRAVAVWLLIAALETVHGVLRALFVAPTVGEAAAERVGLVLTSGPVTAVAGWAAAHLSQTRSTVGCYDANASNHHRMAACARHSTSTTTS